MKKESVFKRVLTIIMTLILLVPLNLSIKVFAEDKPSNDGIVLFEGDKFVKGAWGDTWETITEIPVDDASIYQRPFSLEINYEGHGAPCAIFTSWTGGSEWAQVKASYSSKGTAYYTYEACKEAYGEDFSTLNKIIIKPFGEDVRVTRITLKFNTGEEEINCDFKGTSGEIFKNIKCGWNLGNTLDCQGDWIASYSSGTPSDFETAWGNPVTTKATLDKVKAAGFNAIRIPVTWKQHIGDASTGYKVDEAWMKRVKEVIDFAVQDDFYIILNLHHDVGTEGCLWATSDSVKENSEKFKALWVQIANEFKDYDNKLMFEGFNEILNKECNWDYPGREATTAVNTLNQIFVDTVRKTGGNNPKRCLIVNTYATNTNGQVLDEFVLPKDTLENSLMVQIHFYQPYSYASRINDEWTKQKAWKENSGKGTVDGILLNLYKNFSKKGIPVIMGEFAAASKENTADRAEYASYVVNRAAKHGIKCFWWDEGGKFEADEKYGFFTGMALLNRYTQEWVYPEIVKAFTGQDPNAGEKPVITKGSGDVNGDGVVNINDYTLLKKYINTSGDVKINEKEADVNGDGKMTFLDLLALKAVV